jgi:A/G-specific adenine glycosylase
MCKKIAWMVRDFRVLYFLPSIFWFGMNPPLSLLSHRRTIQRRLLSWFDRNRRDLPWRANRDPYRIWVSEVMLQQTQVATVLRYFEPFIIRFPNIKALAAASELEVLRAWEGLGYYRRAHNLHKAARLLATEHGGRVPNDPKVFGDLPGVGRYILGAVMSQAFDRRLPILEANSRRVLCRLFGRSRERTRRTTSGGDRWLWQMAEVLLPRQRVGDFNQALMELGALVCTAGQPRCKVCPLKRFCVSYHRRLQHEIPGRRPSPTVVTVREAAVVIRRGSRVLLVQRPPTGRWAGMWEFPHDQVGVKETHESAARRIAKAMAGLDVQIGPDILTVKHSITRFRITMKCFEAAAQAGRFRSRFYRQARWFFPSQLPALPVSAPQRKLATSLLNGDKHRSGKTPEE